ncbi:glycosyltransferase [Desulfobulbus propionicus]
MNEHIKKKILFLAYFYPPAVGKALPGSQRTVKFVRYIRCFEKYVLTINQQHYPDFFTINENLVLPIHDEKIIRTGVFDLFAIFLKVKQSLSALLKRHSVSPPVVVTQSPHNPGSFFSQKTSFFVQFKDYFSDLLTLPDFAYPWIFPAFWRGLKIVHKHKIDCIYATGMPWSALIAARMIQLFSSVKVIVDFRDPWVNNPYVSGKSALRKRIEQILEKSIVTAADAVILNTDELRDDFLIRYHWLDENKFHTLMNGYDEHDFSQLNTEETADKTSLQLTLAHAGFLYGARDPKPIFQAIERIHKKIKNAADKIVFQQIGDVSLNYDLHGFLEKSNCSSNYQEIGQINYKKCLEMMAKADVLVIIQQATATQIPSKIYEYVYLNKPILTISEKRGALANLIYKYQFGNLFAPNEIDELADYLLERIREKETKIVSFQNHCAQKIFDVKNITRQLEEIIKSVIGTK